MDSFVTRSGCSATRLGVAVLFQLHLLAVAAVSAQGITGAAITGSTSGGDLRPLDAHVVVTQQATGFSMNVRSSAGRFHIEGLEPGGPYLVTVRAVGFRPDRRERVFLRLGELTEIRFILQPVASQIDSVVIVAHGMQAYDTPNANGGTGSTISEYSLDRLPTLNRDLYDFVRLVPQVSTKVGLANPGISAGGTGFRFNNFLINGVSERSLSGGVSAAFSGRKSIPLDAVQEYQVLLSPYDVRYGDFAGALVNTITKSGTNTLSGSAFVFARDDRLGSRRAGAASPSYEKVQYGFSLGGPIVRNRLHFFIAPELQHLVYPAPGPYTGQPDNADRDVPVTASDLERFDRIMRGYGLTAGSSGPIENASPLRNLVTRLDLSVPRWNSRLLLWNNYGGSDDSGFSRAARDTFSLSSYRVARRGNGLATAVQLHTGLRRKGGGHNEVLVSHRSERLESVAPVDQPIVRVSVPAVSGGRVTLNSGTHETAQGLLSSTSATSVKENITLPFGTSHVGTFGAEVERFLLARTGAVGQYPSWTFGSLDDMALGIADRYEVRIDFGTADLQLSGAQYSLYMGDRWQAHSRLSVTTGLRADFLAINERPPYSPLLDSLFNRRTNEMPRKRVELSPRVGFIWDMTGLGRQHLRGGAGIFTSRYPLAWAHSAISNYGVGGVLRCSRGSPAVQAPPAFTPEAHSPPAACLGGAGITSDYPGDVDLLDRNLRMMRVIRGSVAYDHRLREDFLFSNEAVFTRSLSDFVFVNLNLAASDVTDSLGRVMYGTIGAGGVSVPRRRSSFSEVIDVRNTDRNRSYQFSTRLEKLNSAGMSGSASYTYSRTRDVQTPLRVNTRGTTAWSSARVNSGSHDDLTLGISSNDVPHRVVVAGTYATRSARAGTGLSFYYVGESGRPFTYTAFGALGRGDLNADGSNANDPVYVPRSALDTAEIQFSGFSDLPRADNSLTAQSEREMAQRNAFERFIMRFSCLRSQRGRILERNSCREPWSNTTIASLRQSIPFASRAVELQLDIFNVLNLVRGNWGIRRESTPALLEHVGQTNGAGATSRPIFKFHGENTSWTTVQGESAFQLQLALRYRF